MIVKVSKTGAESGFLCHATVKIPFGSKGVQLMSIDVPSNAGVFSDEFCCHGERKSVHDSSTRISCGFNETIE